MAAEHGGGHSWASTLGRAGPQTRAPFTVESRLPLNHAAHRHRQWSSRVLKRGVDATPRSYVVAAPSLSRPVSGAAHCATPSCHVAAPQCGRTPAPPPARPRRRPCRTSAGRLHRAITVTPRMLQVQVERRTGRATTGGGGERAHRSHSQYSAASHRHAGPQTRAPRDESAAVIWCCTVAAPVAESVDRQAHCVALVSCAARPCRITLVHPRRTPAPHARAARPPHRTPAPACIALITGSTLLLPPVAASSPPRLHPPGPSRSSCGRLLLVVWFFAVCPDDHGGVQNLNYFVLKGALKP